MVGQYVVLGRLAQGGYGVIFRVRSLSKCYTYESCSFFISSHRYVFIFIVDNNIYVMKEIGFEDANSMETAH